MLQRPRRQQVQQLALGADLAAAEYVLQVRAHGVERELECRGGFLLDGFPRTADQVRFLDEMLHRLGRSLDGVIYLRLEDDAIVTSRGVEWLSPINHRIQLIR